MLTVARGAPAPARLGSTWAQTEHLATTISAAAAMVSGPRGPVVLTTELLSARRVTLGTT